MSDYEIDNANSQHWQQPQSDAPHHVWQYFAVTNNADVKKGRGKIDICMFCDKGLSGNRAAAAHISGPHFKNAHWQKTICTKMC